MLPRIMPRDQATLSGRMLSVGAKHMTSARFWCRGILGRPTKQPEQGLRRQGQGRVEERARGMPLRPKPLPRPRSESVVDAQDASPAEASADEAGRSSARKWMLPLRETRLRRGSCASPGTAGS